jgi:hypothetical protein
VSRFTHWMRIARQSTSSRSTGVHGTVQWSHLAPGAGPASSNFEVDRRLLCGTYAVREGVGKVRVDTRNRNNG